MIPRSLPVSRHSPSLDTLAPRGQPKIHHPDNGVRLTPLSLFPRYTSLTDKHINSPPHDQHSIRSSEFGGLARWQDKSPGRRLSLSRSQCKLLLYRLQHPGRYPSRLQVILAFDLMEYLIYSTVKLPYRRLPRASNRRT